MSYTRRSKAALLTAVSAGMMLASSAAMATPTLELTVTNTATGGTDSFSGSAISSETSDLGGSGTLGDYQFDVSATATDLTRTDELFEVNITTSTDSAPSGRLETDLVASGYTGFSGLTRASSVITPTSVDDDLDIETSVDGTTILDEENLTGADAVSGSQYVSMSSPYTIRHFSEIEHDSIDTTTFDTTTTVVPAPATLGLMGAALIGLGVAARRRRDLDA